MSSRFKLWCLLCGHYVDSLQADGEAPIWSPSGRQVHHFDLRPLLAPPALALAAAVHACVRTAGGAVLAFTVLNFLYKIL